MTVLTGDWLTTMAMTVGECGEDGVNAQPRIRAWSAASMKPCSGTESCGSGEGGAA